MGYRFKMNDRLIKNPWLADYTLSANRLGFRFWGNEYFPPISCPIFL